MIKSVLIANRAEIAVRLIRTYRELGIETVAVYSDADAGALHVRLADRAQRIGPAPVVESYLDVDAVVEAALDVGVEAVDPGYGLLSENAEFARRVIDAGLQFIGPSPDVIAQMADKVAARAVAAWCKVPVVPGSDGVVTSAEEAMALAAHIGYPLIVKSAHGGGGRGMRTVADAGALEDALVSAAEESRASFGRPEVFLERHVTGARHIEVQIVADSRGNVIHLGDRDCSVQRRHQKIIEEAPAPDLPPHIRAEIAGAAVRLAGSVGYQSTGTVEFLYEPAAESFFFLEMNTRLQVEHGVTELITGIDLVALRALIASGEELPFGQEDVSLRGHSIQVRLTAEDPWRSFLPTPGVATSLRVPAGPWLRADMGIAEGDPVAREYDSMFGKILSWGPNRESARRRMLGALDEFVLEGFSTNGSYCAQILDEPEFRAVTHTTTSIADSWPPDPDGPPLTPITSEPGSEQTAWSGPMEQATSRDAVIVTETGPLAVTIFGRTVGDVAVKQRTAGRGDRSLAVGTRATGQPVAPMDGVITAVHVVDGDRVASGDVIAVVEAMKMQIPIKAEYPGAIANLGVAVGAAVTAGQQIAEVTAEAGHFADGQIEEVDSSAQ